MKLYRCPCLRKSAKSIFSSLKSVPGTHRSSVIIRSVSPAFSHTDTTSVLAARKSAWPASSSSSPPSLFFSPCSRKQWPSLQQHSLWENAQSLAGERGTPGNGRKRRKMEQTRGRETRTARFREETHCQMYCMFVFNSRWQSEGRDMSRQRHAVKRSFNSSWCLSSVAPEMPVISCEIITWKQVQFKHFCSLNKNISAQSFSNLQMSLCKKGKREVKPAGGTVAAVCLNNGIHCELRSGKTLAPHYRWTTSPSPNNLSII